MQIYSLLEDVIISFIYLNKLSKMAYPYLPVNPCCTDVVLNTPCGCSSTITNSGCNNNNPCNTHLTASSTIVYDGPALTCTTAEPCDTLNVILQKIDEIICNLLTQINALSIQVENITTQIITINNDVIVIQNALDVCCNVTTTTTTTIAPVICESFSLTNTSDEPVAIIITDCYSDEQEAIVLMPGDTNICVVTDSELIVPGTVLVVPNGPCGTTTTTSSTTAAPTTTSTTTASPCECLIFYNEDVVNHIITYKDCEGILNGPITILPNQTLQYCGCCGLGSDPLVTISIGENCIAGECPSGPTTTTTSSSTSSTTTTSTSSTTTTTTTVKSCDCTEIVISQTDLDDATGNSISYYNGRILMFAPKEITCEGENIDPQEFTTAGSHFYCLKTDLISSITLSYWKDDVPDTPVVDSEVINLLTDCLVDGTCVPTTTTTTTLSPA